MGLFSRKESAAAQRSSSRPRPSVSSEAQAASMRVRARRRLAGAVALVLAAVIVLPMLLDGEPQPIPASVQVTVPKRDMPFQPDLQPPTIIAQSDVGTVSGAVSAPSTPSSEATTKAPEAVSVNTPTTSDLVAAPSKKPEPMVSKAETESKPPAQSQRTDDGAKALALLEGRAPVTSSAAAPSGTGFVVQVASYSSQSDAHARRDKLRSEGVTNAFVESTTVNGKPTFRLRVGPFGSRDAAQAAQTRLRSLGYPNGFIATQ